MADAERGHLRWLVGQYLDAVGGEEACALALEAARKRLTDLRNRKISFSDTLRILGIDTDNIPSDLLPEAHQTPVLPLSEQPAAIDEAGDAESTLKPENNGHSAAGEGGLKKSHALFLVFHKYGAFGLTSGEVYQYNVNEKFGLTKEEIWRGLSQQVQRGKLKKDSNSYSLTPSGEASVRKVLAEIGGIHKS